MIPKNLILPLIALGLYTQANNLNLCNNTTMLIIILALLIEQKEIENITENNDNIINLNNNGVSPQNTTTCPCQQCGQAQTHSHWGYPQNNYYPGRNNVCGCNTVVY